MRIALLLCAILGISCVTAQQATVQSQLSTNQTLNLYWTCNFPYATATDDQGVVYSSCTGNNGSTGILWTYRDNSGTVQTGWVTSPGNGSCLQSWGLSVSHDGNTVFATCYGNPQPSQIMYYNRQMNGSTWYYTPQPLLNMSSWTCGRDIIYDSMTEDVYGICGASLPSTNNRLIRFPYNETSDGYNAPQDLGIPANYIKYNPLNNYLYYATTANLGYLVIHNDNGSAIDMPNNQTSIPVNGTLANYCEITSFTFAHNSSNTVFVGCTGVHSILTQYSSYSILRIDMNASWTTVTVPNNNNNTMNNNSTNSNSTDTNNSTGNINTTSTTVLTWSFSVFNVTSTDSKKQGVDGSQDLSYPADGSCKGPSDMEVDSMNQLYVACMQNPNVRSVIRYTQINSTYYLPAYVTTPAECAHPQTNSLTLTSSDAVIVSCYINNIGLEFAAPNGNNTGFNGSSSSSSSSSSTGFNGNTSSSTGSFSGSSQPTRIPGGNGTFSGSSSSTGGVFSSSSTGVVCVNGTCHSSSTGLGNGSGQVHVDVMILFISALLMMVFV